MDSKEAPGWLRTVFTKRRHHTARVAQGYRDHSHRAQHRYRTAKIRSDNECVGECVFEAALWAAMGWTMRSRRKYTPIYTLVSGKEGFLRKQFIVALTYVIRPRNDTLMSGSVAIVVGQTYHIRTKLVLLVDMDVVATVVPQRYS